MFGEILAGVGAISSLVGGSKKDKAQTAPTSGFAALPKAVQDAWLKTYLPKVMAEAEQPFKPLPMVRAGDPNYRGSSESLGALNFQKYNDALKADRGYGYFEPKTKQEEETETKKLTSSEYDELLGRIMAGQQGGNKGPARRVTLGAPGTLSTGADYGLFGKLGGDLSKMPKGDDLLAILAGVDQTKLSPGTSQFFNWGAV